MDYYKKYLKYKMKYNLLKGGGLKKEFAPIPEIFNNIETIVTDD